MWSSRACRRSSNITSTPLPEVWPPLGLLLYPETHQDLAAGEVGWSEQRKKTTNSNLPNTQASPRLPRNDFSVDLANNDPRGAIASLKPKNVAKTFAIRPVLVWKSTCPWFEEVFITFPSSELALHPNIFSLTSPFQPSCLKPPPSLHEQCEGAGRGRSWACLLSSAQEMDMNATEMAGPLSCPTSVTVILSHFAPLPAQAFAVCSNYKHVQIHTQAPNSSGLRHPSC